MKGSIITLLLTTISDYINQMSVISINFSDFHYKIGKKKIVLYVTIPVMTVHGVAKYLLNNYSTNYTNWLGDNSCEITIPT